MRKSRAGFTMIELLVSVSVMVILSVIVVNLFLATVKGSRKDLVLREVKQNGDFTLVQMENMLRKAVRLKSVQGAPECALDMTQIGLEAVDGGVTEYYLFADRIASNSAYLTADDIVVSGLDFDCRADATNQNTYIDIAFTMTKGNVGVDRVEDVAKLEFNSGVVLRLF